MGAVIDNLKKVITIDTVIHTSAELSMDIEKNKVALGIMMELFFKEIQNKLKKGILLSELTSLQGSIATEGVFGDGREGLYQMMSMGCGYDKHLCARLADQLISMMIASLYILQAEKGMDNEAFVKLVKKDQRLYDDTTTEKVYRNPKNVVGLPHVRRARVYNKVMDSLFFK